MSKGTHEHRPDPLEELARRCEPHYTRLWKQRLRAPAKLRTSQGL